MAPVSSLQVWSAKIPYYNESFDKSNLKKDCRELHWPDTSKGTGLKTLQKKIVNIKHYLLIFCVMT